MSNRINGGVSGKPIGSITSRCSGNEPALLPRMHGWKREDSFVSLNQSDIRPQIFVGHKLPRHFVRSLLPVMADDVELINGMRENFRANYKYRKFTTRNARKVCQCPRCVHFSATMYESSGSETSDND